MIQFDFKRESLKNGSTHAHGIDEFGNKLFKVVSLSGLHSIVLQMLPWFWAKTMPVAYLDKNRAIKIHKYGEINFGFFGFAFCLRRSVFYENGQYEKRLIFLGRNFSFYVYDQSCRNLFISFGSPVEIEIAGRRFWEIKVPIFFGIKYYKYVPQDPYANIRHPFIPQNGKKTFFKIDPSKYVKALDKTLIKELMSLKNTVKKIDGVVEHLRTILDTGIYYDYKDKEVICSSIDQLWDRRREINSHLWGREPEDIIFGLSNSAKSTKLSEIEGLSDIRSLVPSFIPMNL